MGTYGRFYNLGGVVAANGPIASACSVGLSEAESDGCGTLKITCGPKYIRSSRSDGYMLMRVRRPGTSRGYMLKVSILHSQAFSDHQSDS